jgi:hypothetical protein
VSTVRGWRLRCSDGGGGSSGHRQGPAAPKVKEEGEGHGKMAGRRPRVVLIGEGVRRRHSSSISLTAVTLRRSATDKRR